MTNYYEILGVGKDSSQEDIKKAYKKLAMQWHPDRNIGNKAEAEEKFKKISQAYSTLSDPEKRKKYDLGSNDDSSNFGFGDEDVDDIFSRFFGSQFQQSQQFRNFGNFGNSGPSSNSHSSHSSREDPFANFMRGQSKIQIEHKLKCSLEDLHNGRTKKMKIDGKQIDVVIKPGSKDGNRIVHNDTNHKIIFVIEQMLHSLYKRENDDLHLTMTIQLNEAVKGFSKKIKLIDGTHEVIEFPPLKTSDYKHVLAGKGMRSKNGKNGNLIVSFVVNFS